MFATFLLFVFVGVLIVGGLYTTPLYDEYLMDVEVGYTGNFVQWLGAYMLERF